MCGTQEVVIAARSPLNCLLSRKTAIAISPAKPTMARRRAPRFFAESHPKQGSAPRVPELACADHAIVSAAERARVLAKAILRRRVANAPFFLHATPTQGQHFQNEAVPLGSRSELSDRGALQDCARTRPTGRGVTRRRGVVSTGVGEGRVKLAGVSVRRGSSAFQRLRYNAHFVSLDNFGQNVASFTLDSMRLMYTFVYRNGFGGIIATATIQQTARRGIDHEPIR